MRALKLLPDSTYIPVMDVSASIDCIFLLNIFLILTHRMSDFFVENFEHLGL